MPQQQNYMNSPQPHHGYPDETLAHDMRGDERHHSYASYQDDRHNSLSGQTYGDSARGIAPTTTPPAQYGHYSVSPVSGISPMHQQQQQQQQQQFPVRTSEYPQYSSTSYPDHRSVENPQQYSTHHNMTGWPGN